MDQSTTHHMIQDASPRFVIVSTELFDTLPAIGLTAGWVYLYLKLRAGPQETCFPAATTISNALGINEKTVRTALKSLESNGLISVQRRHRDDGQRTTNLTTILPPPGKNVQNLPVKMSGSPPVKMSDYIYSDYERDSDITTPVKKSKRMAGTPMPYDFHGDPIFAKSKGMTDFTIAHEQEAFREYNRKTTALDWDGKWRTWCLNWVKYGSKQVTPTASTKHHASQIPDELYATGDYD